MRVFTLGLITGLSFAFSSSAMATLQKVYNYDANNPGYVYSGGTVVNTSNKKRSVKRSAPRKIGWTPHYGHPSSIETNGKRTLVIHPMWLTWGAYDENGNLVKMGRASLGKNYCPDIGRGCRTPSGTFTVYRKGNANCKSSKYPVGKGGAPMPHCMFFNGGYALHGSPHVPNWNASHGCVRLQPTDAKWLHANFIKIGTKVVVKPYGAKPTASTPKPVDSVENTPTSNEI